MIAEYDRAGIDEILIVMQLGRIPHEEIMRSIERVGKEVIPYV